MLPREILGVMEIVPTERPNAYLVRVDGADQSHVDLDDPTRLEFDYVRRMGDVLDAWQPVGDPVRIVHVGGAAMTLPRYVAATRPRSSQIVLEPAAELTDLVRSELPLPRRSGIKVRPVDGRSGATDLRDDSADLVILDAFDGARVPADLVTAEFFAAVARILGDADYIRDRVRTGDQDRYWAALLAPQAVRTDLLALYAFNIEIAQIAEQVSEPQLGEIRLEWWREALNAAIAGGTADHPVLRPLAAAVSDHGLPPDLLEGLIGARSFDLAREPMPDFAALRAYLLATAGAVFRLGARISGAADAASAASDHAAVAYGLTGLMRALPYHTARGQIFIPADLLAKHGLHPQILLDGEDNQDVRAALRDLRHEAFATLAAARQALRPVRGGALAPFLPLALVEPYLKALAAPSRHPLRDVAQINPLRRYALIWRAHLRGRI